jgi:hypothetical protein
LAVSDTLRQIALAEFQTLREEIAAHQRTKTQYLTLGLTATGTIGAFALGRNGNRDALLVLPLVLSGLTIVYLRHNIDMELLGEYVREHLWPVLQDIYDHSGGKDISPLPSWDEWIETRRAELTRRSTYGALGLLPPFFIYGAPSIGALVIAHAQAAALPLALVWWLDIAAVAGSILLTAWAATNSPGWKNPRRTPTSVPSHDTRPQAR